MANDEEQKEKRVYTREKVRALCRFELDGEVHSGFLLNLSARGLFLQTRLRLPAGTELELKIRDLGDQPIEVLARVVHRAGSHRATASVETGGMGFEILNAPEALYKLLYDLEGP
ncbi:MAG: PilZ domain-containing protein [Deltaproteobacteria bacterium]|nr:PilZ domain-containing protein [Deltaproteobacteria bacterium]MBW2448384.1 PilZ domain-containing protein [Deltaproteobacteria bacterium]